MAKLPAFQFYPGDWRKDVGVQSLNYFDRGVWWEMLCLMHETERRGVLVLNGLAMDEESLASLLGLDKQILTTTLTNLLTKGVASREPDTGAIYCRRIVRDEKLRKIRSESGIKGGNPVLLNQKPTTIVKQNSTPSAGARAEDEAEDEEYSKKKLSTGANGEFMAAGYILEELCVVGRDRLTGVAAEAIQGLVTEGGTVQTATEYILASGKNALAAGEIINRFWFTDQRYRPVTAKPTRRAQEKAARTKAFMEATID